jgi:CDP-glucose 4,6-dehydratase
MADADVVCFARTWPPRALVCATELLQRVKVVRADIRDQAAVARALGEYEIDTVFHVAAQAIVGEANRNPVPTFETNVQGTWGLLDACRHAPSVRQIVVASSDKAYGEQATLPYREGMALLGHHPYEASKACADMIATAYALSYDLPVAVTRCGNFFGGGDLNWNRIIPGTIRSLLKPEPPLVRSDGRYVRDYLYADDGAAAHMLLAHKLADDRRLAGEAFNFSYEVRLTVLELVERVARLLGSTLSPDVRNETMREIREQYLSTEKARQTLGWTPHYSMDDALRHTIEWYRGYLAAEKGDTRTT